jgi:hypothetical protein
MHLRRSGSPSVYASGILANVQRLLDSICPRNISCYSINFSWRIVLCLPVHHQMCMHACPSNHTYYSYKYTFCSLSVSSCGISAGALPIAILLVGCAKRACTANLQWGRVHLMCPRQTNGSKQQQGYPAGRYYLTWYGPCSTKTSALK